MKLGEKIRHQRRILDMTQEELGDMIGVGKATISSYERGINKIDSDTLTKIAKALYVSADWLLDLPDDDLNDDTEPVFLNAEERRLLSIYRSKSPEDAQKLIVIAETL